VTISETNENARLHAQRYLDRSKSLPLWAKDLHKTCEQYAHDKHMIQEAMEIIDEFPIGGEDRAVDAHIATKTAEACLHAQDELVDWITKDKNRFHYLDKIMDPDGAPTSLLDCLRAAYQECLKDTISTIEVFLETIPA